MMNEEKTDQEQFSEIDYHLKEAVKLAALYGWEIWTGPRGISGSFRIVDSVVLFILRPLRFK